MNRDAAENAEGQENELMGGEESENVCQDDHVKVQRLCVERRGGKGESGDQTTTRLRGRREGERKEKDEKSNEDDGYEERCMETVDGELEVKDLAVEVKLDRVNCGDVCGKSDDQHHDQDDDQDDERNVEDSQCEDEGKERGSEVMRGVQSEGDEMCGRRKSNESEESENEEDRASGEGEGWRNGNAHGEGGTREMHHTLKECEELRDDETSAATGGDEIPRSEEEVIGELAQCSSCSKEFWDDFTGDRLHEEKKYCKDCAFTCLCDFLVPYTEAYVCLEKKGPFCRLCWEMPELVSCNCDRYQRASPEFLPKYLRIASETDVRWRGNDRNDTAMEEADGICAKE